MKKTKFICTLLLLASTLGVHAQEKPALTWKDVSKWTFNRGNSLSANGQWLAWASGPTEGDLKLTIKKTFDTLQYSYPIGAVANTAVFSKDSKYAAFKVSLTDAEAKAAKKTNKQQYDKLTIVSLANNKSVVFERVKSFDFSGEQADWIAIQFAALENAAKDKDAAKGTDVILYQLSTKKIFNIGNVSELAFNKAGTQLAYLIDANGQNGNGVFLRDMKTGITTALDNDKASYKSLNWNDVGTAFALLKSNKNDKYKDEVYSVLGFNKLNGEATVKTVYNGLEDANFTKGMGINENANPYWSDDQGTLFFGINTLEKKEDKKTDSKKDSTATAKTDPKKTTTKTDSAAKVKTDSLAKTKAQPKKEDIEKPDVSIWNWQDKRLQSAQQTQEMRDKKFSYLSAYRLADKKFVQLADSITRTVTIAPNSLYAIGYDLNAYELMANLDGQSYADIYLTNLKTGVKKLLFKKMYTSSGGRLTTAPNGKIASYYEDGIFYSIDFETGKKSNLTGKIKSSFVDALDDHNIQKPATQNLGWSADSKFALIKDNFDLWKISADGNSVTPLSNNWKAKKQEVNYRYSIYDDEKGIDLNKDQYFAVFDTQNKQAGIGLLASGKNKIEVLFMDNNTYSALAKAEKSETYVFTKSNFANSPTLYASASPKLLNPKQTNTNTPDQAKYAWTAGVKLINYVSANGDSLQAAMYLPANYQQGKSYPTITYIYERLTDNLNAYNMPSFPGGGFNTALYTSNGYVVLMPDIKYKLNDPGMSAVACVVPAVQAAIATGIVDAKNVAIHGHSWGGYQTSFLITQTNIFKAAAAGAPLTNMISMYSLIYWNSGGANQAIFESSQGRLTPGYWDNWDAFTRNSPIYHIKKVQTPLLLLHNDKDGAVDYTQGIEYYNGLRRLNKPVVMITYKGENHGISKLPNRKDYAVRMMEYFDYQLKGKPAPDWWSKGINRLDMEKHLENRAFDETQQN
ncbi:alpha/beta hydrolase family protein [Pedobacter sp. AW1-32]|uniref:alpha/beta hydrolase family protein n=1 Tax=Pedobacter sp. AW1-32 TaxID=3383026 RepID=UPI003FEE63A9